MLHVIESVGSTCTGCRACASICPKKCISFESREFGHLYPVVDTGACVSCGRCQETCPALMACEGDPFYGEAFAFQALDGNLLADSSSGAAFGVIASRWIEEGGVVYGSMWDRGCGARHTRVDSVDELGALRRSKYVQSSLEGVFDQIRNDFEAGRRILFAGVPCQVSAVKTVFRREGVPCRLTTIDLVCHGVPSAALFEDYLTWLQSKKRSEVVAYHSRDKKHSGWSCLGSVVLRRNGTVKEGALPANDPYVMCFGQGATFRSSCYTCAYANFTRVGDITLGDFWGAERLCLGFDLNLGLSAVLVNTEAGWELLASCKREARIVPVTFADVAKGNSSLIAPSLEPVTRRMLQEAYEKGGFSALANATSQAFRREAFTSRLKQLMPTGLKRMLKSVAGLADLYA